MSSENNELNPPANLALHTFRREMTAARAAEPDPAVREMYGSILLLVKALDEGPADEAHRQRILACLQDMATKIAARRQAQGGGR